MSEVPEADGTISDSGWRNTPEGVRGCDTVGSVYLPLMQEQGLLMPKMVDEAGARTRLAALEKGLSPRSPHPCF